MWLCCVMFTIIFSASCYIIKQWCKRLSRILVINWAYKRNFSWIASGIFSNASPARALRRLFPKIYISQVCNLISREKAEVDYIQFQARNSSFFNLDSGGTEWTSLSPPCGLLQTHTSDLTVILTVVILALYEGDYFNPDQSIRYLNFLFGEGSDIQLIINVKYWSELLYLTFCQWSRRWSNFWQKFTNSLREAIAFPSPIFHIPEFQIELHDISLVSLS